jgi:uncharacterized protein (DUF433 family)
MATAVTYPHIDVRPDGVAYIAGTQLKLAEIVLWRMAHAWDAHEIHRQHPQLSLAQIHSALAYYYDHQDAVDDEIERRLRHEQQILNGLSESPLRQKLVQARRSSTER